jgi:carbon monoxide dehydrogenase subunit G
MEVRGDHHFKAPRDIVWQCMLDPKALQASMPGCEKMTAVGPDDYDIAITVGLAAIKGHYTGNVKVKDQRPGEGYKLVVSGSGKPGSVQGEAVMTLSDHQGGTLVMYHGDVKAQGAIARLGSRLLGGAAKLMIGQFMKGMEKQVEARTV